MAVGAHLKTPWFVGFIMWPAIYGGIDFSFYWYFIHFVMIAIGLLGVWNLAYKLTKKLSPSLVCHVRFKFIRNY